MSTAQPVTLTLDESGTGTLTIDGHDLSNIVGPEFTFQRRTNSLPVLTVNIPRACAALSMDAARVEVDAETATALKALGWVKA